MKVWTQRYTFILFIMLGFTTPVRANSCKLWLNKLFKTEAYKTQKLQELRTVENEANPIQAFYDRVEGFRDSSTNLGYFLPGTKESKSWSFKGQPITTFHALRKDNFCSEHLAIYHGQVVVLKVFDHPEVWEDHLHGFKSRFDTEVLVPNYLKTQKQLKVVEVIDHSFEDRIIIKEFIPGIPFKRIQSDTKKIILNEPTIISYALDAEIDQFTYQKINENLRILDETIAFINQRDHAFKKWAHKSHILAYIDLSMPQTTLYWNGSWYINSPYALY